MASSEAGPSRPLIDPAVVAASSIAALTARVVTHPLDTVRLRVQTHHGAHLPPLRQLLPRTLAETYAGLPVALAFSVPALSAYLTSYEAAKRLWTPLLMDPAKEAPSLLEQFPAYMLSGLTAEVISGWLWTPMEVAKSRLQKGKEGTSAAKLLRKVWREEGARGVWRGYTVSIAVFGPYTATYWPVYEELKTELIPGYDARRGLIDPARADPTLSLTPRYAACAAAACGFSASLTHPIAVVQSVVQTGGGKVPGAVDQAALATGKGGHVSETVKAMWRNGGPKAFTRGLAARLIYMIPSSVTSLVIYEQLKRLIIA